VAKQKKKASAKKSSTTRPKPKGKAVPKAKKAAKRTKKSRPVSKTPWLNKNGTPNKRYSKIAKYLTKDGKIRKNAKLPFKVKTAKALFNKLYPSKLPPWYTKSGRIRKDMQKYLTKAGTIRKNVKLPKGVKTIEQLWIWVQAQKVNARNKQKKEDDKVLICEEFNEDYWKAHETISRIFNNYIKVFMGGKQITKKIWELYGNDHINENTNEEDSPPQFYYTECYFKKNRKYKYLFL